MATQFLTTTIYDKLIGKMLKDNGAFSVQIGGLSSDSDWTLAYPSKLQGNNLSIIQDTYQTVVVKAGVIWYSGVVLTHAADETIGTGQTITLTANSANRIWAISTGGPITLQVTQNNSVPANAIKQIGVVYVDYGGTIHHVVTRPEMVNQIASASATVQMVGWDQLTPASASGSFSASNALNCLELTAQFDLSGTNKIGEFALTTGYSVPSAEVLSPTYIIAYLARDTQVVVADALLVLKWRLIVNTPPAFYPIP